MMKFTLLLLANVFASALSLAEVSATLSIRKGATIPEQTLKSILSSSQIIQVKPVFTTQENIILNKLGSEYLSSSMILIFKSKKDYASFKTSLKAMRLPVALDRREMEIKSQSLSLKGMQWALNNTGDSQNIDLDPLISYKVPGRAGEDIGLKNVTLQALPNKTIVAVIDTGIQSDHPALKNVIHKNKSECVALEKFKACLAASQNPTDKERQTCEKTWMSATNPEVDQDHNNYPLDCSGWSMVVPKVNEAGIFGRPDFSDTAGHGTHIAGIIAAQQVDGFGTLGVTPNAEILPIQAIMGAPSEPIKPLSLVDPTDSKLPPIRGRTLLADMVARGVLYAINSGAKVINFSMGWPQEQDSTFMRQMIQEAQSRGIVVVAAAGNDSTRALLRPCAYPGVVCVAANGPDGALANYSNYGSGVDIAAPGTNILSTYPEDIRPIRMRMTNGYEFLSGTSQATPFVTGLIAEMMARGMNSQEAYARLILGARPVQSPLDLISNLPNKTEDRSGKLLQSPVDQNKFILSGNVDFKRALAVQPQPLILPASKEKIEIKWNRSSPTLNWQFQLKNFWLPIDAAKIKIEARILAASQKSIRPRVTGIALEKADGIWASNEVRTVNVTLAIEDDAPFKSRIPSDLDLKVRVTTDTAVRDFVLESEVISIIDMSSITPDIQVLTIDGMPKARTDFIPVNFKLDGKFNQDYVLSSYDSSTWQYWLMTQPSKQDSGYKVVGSYKIDAVKKDPDQIREAIFRVDANGDGTPEYIHAIYDDHSQDDTPSESPLIVNVLDNHFQLVEHYTYDSKKSQVPYFDSLKWMKINGKYRPSWIGPGYATDKKRSLWDEWQDPDNKLEQQESRFYFLNEKNEIKSLTSFQEFRIVDALQQTVTQSAQGVVPILLAKNHGGETSPSYIYDFAIAEVINGEVQNFKKINLFDEGQIYRNLLDTRVGTIYSLDYENEVAKGTFWFSEGKTKEQRLSTLTNKSFRFSDYDIAAVRQKVDATLWVRAVFAGKVLQGAFSLTNSEIQYHDLNSGMTAVKSMERYTFFPQNVYVDLQNPLVISDNRLQTKLPAIWMTESSGLSRGIRITVPSYSADTKELVELISPARLRLRAESGCKPLDAAIWGGQANAASLDYFCSDRSGQKILRVDLNY